MHALSQVFAVGVRGVFFFLPFLLDEQKKWGNDLLLYQKTFIL